MVWIPGVPENEKDCWANNFPRMDPSPLPQLYRSYAPSRRGEFNDWGEKPDVAMRHG